MKSKYGFDTTPERSFLMSKIRSKGTKPERILAKELWSIGIRYRLSNNNIIGKPDIAISKYKLAIFVDGEFWHGYNWHIKKEKIKSNREYWIKKIEGNINRDSEINIELRRQGWFVMRFWEHEVNVDLRKCIKIIMEYIDSHA